MELYQRIRQRRNELNMSQDELASKLGYKSRSTIAKIESGTNDIPQSKIKDFADALGVTPSYLMGWEQIEKDYEFSTNLINTYYTGIMKWSEDKLLKKHEVAIMRGHISDLFLRYKLLIEQYVYAQRRWHRDKENFSKFYKEKGNPLNDQEIKELYLKQELQSGMENLSNWVNALPSWVSTEENKYLINNTTNINSVDDNPYILPNAAHEIEGASDEDKAHDNALMDDDNF